jgi:hypothetical protein
MKTKTTMKKMNYRTWTQLVIGTGIFMLLNSCELTDDIGGNVTVAKLDAVWSCDEDSEYFKKSTAEIYEVQISPDPDNENGIIIDGFYGLNGGVKATVSNLVITLPGQVMEQGNTLLSGQGIVSGNYNEITWSYDINIGGDAVDNVTAIYTKVD